MRTLSQREINIMIQEKLEQHRQEEQARQEAEHKPQGVLEKVLHYISNKLGL